MGQALALELMSPVFYRLLKVILSITRIFNLVLNIINRSWKALLHGSGHFLILKNSLVCFNSFLMIFVQSADTNLIQNIPVSSRKYNENIF